MIKNLDRATLQNLLDTKDASLKKYVVWRVGFNQYAPGITGCRYWGYLYAFDGEGWNSRPEAWEWMKKTNHKNYVRKGGVDEGYGRVGRLVDEYRIMRFDKYIKYALDTDNNWYDRTTGRLPYLATSVNNSSVNFH